MSRKRLATYLYERIGPLFLVFSPAPDQALPERATKTKQKAQEDTKANPDNNFFSYKVRIKLNLNCLVTSCNVKYWKKADLTSKSDILEGFGF